MELLEIILVFSALLAAVFYLVWRQAKSRGKGGCGGVQCSSSSGMTSSNPHG